MCAAAGELSRGVAVVFFLAEKISTVNFFLLRKKYDLLTIPLRRRFLAIKAVKATAETRRQPKKELQT
jgi:hypothetical protein